MNLTRLLFDEAIYAQINQFFATQRYGQYVLLVDENTKKQCLPPFIERIDEEMPEMILLEILAGERYKNIQTCVNLWESLSQEHIKRNALIINLGGGVLTDIGGFVASTYKRGVDWVNIPTTLLGMVDASVGGKTGVDLGFLKNQIGTFQSPIFTGIDSRFLSTLPKRELMAGVTEMLKHGLIAEKEHWRKITLLTEWTTDQIAPLIKESSYIKQNIVAQDPTEKGIRKSLNLGHTIGHAIESHFLVHQDATTLLHGEAIAIGIIAECFLSPNLREEEKKEIKTVLQRIFGRETIPETSYPAIFALCKQDKKNTQEGINFTGIHRIGKFQLNLTLDFESFKSALDFYRA